MIKRYRFWGISSALLLLLLQGCSIQNSVKPSEPGTSVSIILPESSTQALAIINKGQIVKSEINDSWQYIISLYAIPKVNNSQIEYELQKFLVNPEYIQKIQLRAQPYLYNIIQQVEEKSLPGELALLPAIESGFKAHAYSRAQAAGLWQFIPSTGKLYGLDQNWWYDGRRDVYSSTEAATSYLQKLGKVFDNDWLLALAAYNAGMGNVSRSMKRNAAKNLPTDFWSLSLPRETRAYVPRLLALAKIFANAEYYGVTLLQQPHIPTFAAVDIGSQLELSKAAQLSNISLEELFNLNPGFSRGYTAPEGPHRLLIPVDQVELFKKNLALLPDDQRVTWQRHKIQRGDNLGSIARRYQTNIQVIRKVNNLKNTNIRAGAFLLIPVSQNTASIQPVSPAGSKKSIAHNDTTYTVKAGDSLWAIARKHDVHSKELAKWNHIGVQSTLSPGQKLLIKKPEKTSLPAATNTTQALQYKVRSGDSLYAISEKFNVSVADLRKWNANRLGKYLKPGQTLTVRVDTNQPAT